MAAKSAAAQLREEMSNMKQTQDQLVNVLGGITAQLSELSKMAKNNPVIISQRDESEEHQIGHEIPLALKSTGPASEALQKRLIDVVDGPRALDKAEALAFNEEILEIIVSDTTDPNEPPIPAVWVNGVSQYFFRNQKQKVKRKFVEQLSRMKRTRYTQQLSKDGNGNEYYSNIPHTALTTPLAIIHDPSGQRGRDWWDKVLKENQ